MKKIIASILAISALGFALCPNTTFAINPTMAQSNSANISKIDLSSDENQRKLLSVWVRFDREKSIFCILDGAEKTLTKEQYDLLSKRIAQTNATLAQVNWSLGEAYIITPEQEFSGHLYKSRSYREGEDKIEFHWWGATIYLSKTTVQKIGTGLSLAGVWIPAGVIGKVVAALGIVVSNCPGGIAFDYTYLIPGTTLIAMRTFNYRFQ